MLENTSQIMTNMYQKGYTAEQIAEVFETDIETVSQYIGTVIMNHKKSDIITPAVCNLYKKDMSIYKIAEQLNTSRQTVRYILRKEGLQMHVPSELEQRAIQLQKEGKSYKVIAQALGIKASKVAGIMRLNGITTEHKRMLFNQRKHCFNEQFFDQITTESQAYWLGFLYADGCVTGKQSEDRGVITLDLAKKDLDHLLKFKEAVQYDSDPTYRHNTRSYRIDLCSRHMCNSLIAHGCVQRKSLILRFPLENQVPANLIHHFMRGYFDGDGHINIPEKQHLSRFQLLGTPQFLDEYERILLSHCRNNYSTKRIVNPKWNENTQAIIYGGIARLRDMFNFLYKDATVYLDRKYNIFKQTLTRPEDKRRMKSLDN